MAVHDCVKPVLYENGGDSDDDAPAIFRRTNTLSKKSQLNSSFKKSSLHHDQTQERPRSNQSIHNGKSTSLQKNKVTSIAKVSPEKAAAVSFNSRASAPTQLKHPSKSGSNINISHSKKSSVEVKNIDDFDDDKPLSSKFRSASVAVQISDSTNPSKVVEHPLVHKMESENKDNMVLDKSCIKNEDSDDDSEDKMPLSAKFLSSLAAHQHLSTLRVTSVNEPGMSTSTPSQKNKVLLMILCSWKG